MHPDLRQPRRTSPLAALFWVFRGEQLRAVLPAAVIAVSSGRLAVVLVGGLVLVVVYGIASWWRRTWSFADGVLQLDEGVAVRNQRRIPVERIQHVELERRLRHQLFDLASLRIETAGGGGAELRLDAIRLREAEAVRSRILEHLRRPPTTATDESASAPRGSEVLVRLTPGRLLLAGVTGPEVLAVLAALGVAFDTLADFGLGPDDVDRVDVSGALLALVVLIAVPLWLAVAGLIGVVRRWDLTAVVEGDDLRVSYGLLRRSEFVAKTTRVQDVRISHRALLRPFGRADVRVRTAASGAGEGSRVDIPLLAPHEIDVVLRRVLPAAAPLPPLDAAPPAARRRALVRGGVVGALGAALLAVAAAGSSPALLVLGSAPLLLGLVRGELWYRGLGVARRAGLVHSQTGTLTRNRTIVPDTRVQSAAVLATFFQRRRGLASVRLDLAGDAVGVVDRGTDEARSILRTSLGAQRPPQQRGPL